MCLAKGWCLLFHRSVSTTELLLMCTLSTKKSQHNFWSSGSSLITTWDIQKLEWPSTCTCIYIQSKHFLTNSFGKYHSIHWFGENPAYMKLVKCQKANPGLPFLPSSSGYSTTSSLSLQWLLNQRDSLTQEPKKNQRY